MLGREEDLCVSTMAKITNSAINTNYSLYTALLNLLKYQRRLFTICSTALYSVHNTVLYIYVQLC